MIPYPLQSLIAVIIFSLVHLFADRARQLNFNLQSHFLSTGSGIALAYIFIDLLPKLSKNESAVSGTLKKIFPYLEHHVYVMALLGFLLFFAVDRSQTLLRKQSVYYVLSLCSYALLNFLIGYAIVDKDDPEVRPLVLFTFAIALHYFLNDYSLTEVHGEQYNKFAKWILIASLFLGWLIGSNYQLSAAGVALMSAFIGGGVIMNVTRHELSDDNPHSLKAILISAIIYTVILLTLGSPNSHE
ncbi:MAG: hypothetical protein H0U49_00970 [Parachlamydiaceae bacterium]|nr:hypothetical protein [Parachlamydiaceae bacterium]